MFHFILPIFLATYVTSVTFTPAEQQLYLSSNFTPLLSTPASDEMAITGYMEFPSQKHREFYFHFDSVSIHPGDEKSILVKKAIMQGMAILEELTCVLFTETDNKMSLKIVYGQDESDCHVVSGVNYGPLRMIMGFRCIAPSTIFHELLHVLGFIHEQGRTDRDKYVKIIDHNSQNERKYVKKIFPFSFTSVMLYPSDPKKMVAQPKYRDVFWPKQNDVFLSRRDVIATNILYNCSVFGGEFVVSDEFEKIVDRLGLEPELLSRMNMVEHHIFPIPQTLFIDRSLDVGRRWRADLGVFERSVRLLVGEMKKGPIV